MTNRAEIRANLIAVYNKYMEKKMSIDVNKPIDLWVYCDLLKKDEEKFRPFLHIAESLEGLDEACDTEEEKQELLNSLVRELKENLKEV